MTPIKIREIDDTEKKTNESPKKILSGGVDATLIAMFLQMSPEERILSNDNAINAILELRNAFVRRKESNRKYRPSA